MAAERAVSSGEEVEGEEGWTEEDWRGGFWGSVVVVVTVVIVLLWPRVKRVIIWHDR